MKMSALRWIGVLVLFVCCCCRDAVLVDAFVGESVRTTATPCRRDGCAPSAQQQQPALFLSSPSSKNRGGPSPVRQEQSGPPLPYGGDIVPRKPGPESLPEAIREFVVNFEWSSVRETITIILRDNILGNSESSKGGAYVVMQGVLVVCILAGTVPFVGGTLAFVAGPCLMVSGIAVMATAGSRMGPALSPFPVPNENTRLLTSGLYSYVRHPMYAGLLAGAVGFSVWTGSAFRLALSIGLWYVLHQKTNYEEVALTQKFGIQYQEYQRKVPDKFIPMEGKILEFLPGWDQPDNDITMF